jgi:hypothetical protein
MSENKRLPIWRSMMFVPVNVDKFVANAHTRGADAIILDLEDSILPKDKERARTLVAGAAPKQLEAERLTSDSRSRKCGPGPAARGAIVLPRVDCYDYINHIN